MPKITINGQPCDFTPGQTVLQVASANGIEIPHYCFHEGLSIVASCRICLAEVWAPNPRNDNKLEPIPKLLPTCQITAQDGQAIYTDSPRALANKKAVMEYLLVNHPLDCPVCDQAGECTLQDYSFEHGRGVSRFEEQKIKQPKKDVGPNVLLYSDRCIMCTRCVRFTREVSGTNELIVDGRGNQEQIDVFPGKALDNPLASNVIDLCPVGALLDKDFLFQKRVWDLTSTPSIDGLTSSGDNLWIDHADGQIYRVRPRANLEVNNWWITDEVRYGWKHVHSEDRLTTPMRRQHGALVDTEWPRAVRDTVSGVQKALEGGKRLAMLVSPMLTCEEAFLLSDTARAFDEKAIFGVGPIPIRGEDQVFPPDAAKDHIQSPRAPKTMGEPRPFVLRAEKCPNSRGVKRVLDGLNSGGTGVSPVADFDAFVARLKRDDIGAVILTGNYPSAWATDALREALKREGLFVVLLDTLNSSLVEFSDIVMPSSTWAEKAGTFENADGRLQAFEPAIRPIDFTKPEGQIAIDLSVTLRTGSAENAAPLTALPWDSAPNNDYSGSPRNITAQPAMMNGDGEHGDGGTGVSPVESAREVGGAMPGDFPRPDVAVPVAHPAVPPRTMRQIYRAAQVRRDMAVTHDSLKLFTTHVYQPPASQTRSADMQVVEL